MCLRPGETLDPFHFSTWHILKHIFRAFLTNSREFEELVLMGKEASGPEASPQASASSQKQGSLVARKEGWSLSENL